MTDIPRRSLRTRLLVVSGLLLVATFGTALVVIEYIFRQSAEQAIAGQLEAQVYALLGAAEPGPGRSLEVPPRLIDPRLANPGSGLYARILDGAGALLWRSPSAVGLDLAASNLLRAGERRLSRRELPDGSEVLQLGMGVDWEDGEAELATYQVYLATDLAAYRDELARFRGQLLGWFAGVLSLALGLLWFALRAGLAPLGRMARELAAVESGRREALGEDHPAELAGVARGLNRLLRSERERIQRYRTTMDDLAHSLKTPVAVLRSELAAPTPDASVLRAQVDRMQAVVDYQLRRAAVTGPRSLAARSLPLAPVVEEVVAGLRKIHRDKPVACTLRMDPDVACAVEPGDLYEIVGNLLDNAWKWCAGQVVVAAESAGREGIRVTVGDDGPGIPPDQASRVLGRGVRADQRGDVPGQGIGLAVVHEIVAVYGGSLAIGRSEAGGAEIRVVLPRG